MGVGGVGWRGGGRWLEVGVEAGGGEEGGWCTRCYEMFKSRMVQVPTGKTCASKLHHADPARRK